MKRKRSARGLRRMLFETLSSRLNFASTFFIDPIAGNDSRDGLTMQTAFKTPAKIVSQYASLQIPGHIDLQPGDSVVLMPGTHNFSYLYGEGQWQGLFFRNVHGTEAQPITIRGLPGAQLANLTPDGSEISSLYILQSSNFVVEGLDVTAHGSAVSIAASDHIVFRDNYVHSASGLANNNLSGLYLSGVSQLVVENNFFKDNYDRDRPGNQNNRHIVLFGCQNTYILGNTFVNSDGSVGMAVDYKHLGGLPANATGTYEVAYNMIVNANGTAIGTSAPNSYIHHNILVDSGGIRVADFGGTNQLANERIEFNTIVNSATRIGYGALEYNADEYPGYPLGHLYWNNNAVVETRSYDSLESSTIVTDRYGSDEFYRRVFEGGLFHADGNLYQTASPTRFDVYGANGGRYGTLGDMLSFAQWQAKGFDRNGASIALAMDTFYRVQPGRTPTAGVYAGNQPRLTVLVERMNLSESGVNSSMQLRLVRSGGSLAQSLQVSLQTSQSNEIRLPQTVTFAAGSDTAVVTLEGIADQTLDLTEAIQVKATASGWRGASTWLMLQNSPAVPGNSTETGVFQVPGQAGQQVAIQSVVQERWAEYNNEMGLAYVDDSSGRVGQLLPGDAGWMEALMRRNQHQVLLRSGAKAGDSGQATVEGGRYFVFYLVQNSTTAAWLQNTTSSRPLLFTSVARGNVDRFDHVRESTSNQAIDLMWEDLLNGGDQSFRDLVVRCTFSSTPNYCKAVDDVFAMTAEQGMIELDLAKNDLPAGQVQIVSTTQPEFGRVTLGTNGKVLLTPAKEQYGTLHFQYVAQSNAVQSTGQVTVSVKKQWTNTALPTDVDRDGRTTALDALLVINVLNQSTRPPLSAFPTGDQAHWAMIDVNADGQITAQDALLVILKLL